MRLNDIGMESGGLSENFPEYGMPEFGEWKIVHHFKSRNGKYPIAVLLVFLLLLSYAECHIEHFREPVTGKVFGYLLGNRFQPSFVGGEIRNDLQYPVIGRGRGGERGHSSLSEEPSGPNGIAYAPFRIPAERLPDFIGGSVYFR